MIILISQVIPHKRIASGGGAYLQSVKKGPALADGYAKDAKISDVLCVTWVT